VHHSPAGRPTSAAFQILHPVRDGFDLCVESTESGGVAFLAQLDR
jgi:hypothetical protein